MQYATFPAIDTAPPSDGGTTAPAQAGMAEIVRHLDSRFMPAGHTLARLVDVMGHVLSGLDVVERVLGHGGGEAGEAAQALLNAAQRLREVPDRQAERSRQVGIISALIKRLGTMSGEIERVLKVLEFYAVNLKIATAGTEGFSEFAEDMSAKLKLGAQEVKAFKLQVAQMMASLTAMLQIDTILGQECARVIPAVPDQLAREVGQLRERQLWLAQTSAHTRRIVVALHQRIGTALGAIQIGDITRQRLEHVLEGCRDFDATLADPHLIHLPAARGHMLRLFSDQLQDLGEEFFGSARELLDTLDALTPDASALLGRSGKDETLAESGQFLRELTGCISEVRGVTSQLDHADHKALEIADIVLSGVDELRQRASVIEGLRYDVDYMAINVNIRARRDGKIGRPVGVIADEIRLTSNQMAQLVAGIVSAADELGTISRSFDNQHSDIRQLGLADTLSSALGIIGQGAEEAEAAMSGVEERAQGIASMISEAREELSICSSLTAQIRAMADSFLVLAETEPDSRAIEADHPIYALIERLGRSYTMQSERVVHNRHLLPGMAPVGHAYAGASSGSSTGSSTASNTGGAADDDDDEALFDDALF